MADSGTGLRMGIDLSDPVRVVLFSKTSDSVIASMTARTGFDPDSRQKLNSLASEIKDFWKPHRVRPHAVAGLPVEGSFLFTVSLPSMSKKELKEAIRLQLERIVPGSSHNVRMAVQKWPPQLVLPPSSGAPANGETYVVAAAEADLVRAAERLMKMAGAKPVGVEIPASPACRISRWMLARPVEEDFDRVQDDSLHAIFNVALDIRPNGALLHLAIDNYPWLMREIPMNPGNLLANAEILAGEVSRSARFIAGSGPGQLTRNVTVLGSSDSAGFIADYLSEQVGIETQVCGPELIQCDAEYGVAAGLALPKEGEGLW